MILVAGIVNVETTLRVEGFPVDYAKSRFAFHGVSDRLGGVGYNVAAGLAALGAGVRLVATVGGDLAGATIRGELAKLPGLDTSALAEVPGGSLRSVVLVDPEGAGAIFTDLKDAQDLAFPEDRFEAALDGATHLHATNINWAHACAARARERGLPVSTDVQAIGDLLGDAYNRRFLELADIVFFSGENLGAPPGDALAAVLANYPARLVICTAGARGVWAAERGAPAIVHQPAPEIDKTPNATGAGDAFAAGFLRAYRAGGMGLAESLAIGQRVAALRITTHGGRWPGWGELKG
ncbi:MAG: carbohydrate kinase family protein [Sumerlaeia bacterium]